ncbi:MAG: DUF5662 family protein [Acetatifactor sp.]|nr:DUF5662 family protein [Acetatifactor sp.]
MSYLKNAFLHFKTISHHRKLVRKGCFKVGLYKQGLLHDLSKYSPDEFFVGVKYFQGFRSPNNAEREDIGYSSSWLHHKGRNKHHYEYWVDYNYRSEPENLIIPVKMPDKYLAEMVMDRIAASKTYNGADYKDSDSLNYYLLGKGKVPINKETGDELEKILRILANEGEEAMYKYVRTEVLHRKS